MTGRHAITREAALTALDTPAGRGLIAPCAEQGGRLPTRRRPLRFAGAGRMPSHFPCALISCMGRLHL